MHDFVPPFPDRPKQPLSAFATLRLARRNFLAIWEERSFEWEVFSTRMLSRTLFVCNSPDTVASAFVEHHDSFERKSPQMRHGLAPLLGDGLFISDGETWRRRRRIVAPIVHVSHLPLFAPLMVQAACETAERWANLPQEMPVNALTEMATLTAEIICRTVFGRQLGAEHAAEIVAAFSEYQRLVGQLDLAYFFGLPDWIPRFHSPAIHRSARRIHRVLEQVIGDCRERLSSGEASMIRLLLEARDPETGEPLDDVALRNEAAVIFMAGHETTANSLAWAWYLLSQAPEVEERLHEELAKVLAGRLPTLDDVPELPYTRAIFEETVRLYPPVPLLARQALCDETIHVTGTTLGSGNVDLNCYAGPGWRTLAADVPASGGTFSFSGSMKPIAGETCVLRAVPAGDSNDYVPGFGAPFNGPTLAIGYLDEAHTGGGALERYDLFAPQLQGAFEYRSLGACTIGTYSTFS